MQALDSPPPVGTLQECSLWSSPDSACLRIYWKMFPCWKFPAGSLQRVEKTLTTTTREWGEEAGRRKKCWFPAIAGGRDRKRAQEAKMVVELRHGVSSSQGPRSYQEDLTIVVPDLRASLKSRPADEPSTTKHTDDASRGDVVDLSNLPSPSAYYGVSGVVTDRFPRAWHCAPGTGARSLLLFRPLRKNRVPHATTFFWLLPFASFVSLSLPLPC